MKAYQALHYRNYYAQDESGDYVLVTRKECFAPSEQHTEANPFKQRWFYDFEAGYAVRLSRDENGELIGKRNGADLKAKERQFTKDKECVLKDTNNCINNCELCNREHTSRLLALDEQWLDSSNSTSGITDTSNPADIFESLELREELRKALSTLSTDEQKLIAFAFSGLSERDSAKELGLARKTFTYRRDRLTDRLKKYFQKL